MNAVTHNAYGIAWKAKIDHRTAKNVLLGKRVHPLVRQAVEVAAKELGISIPA